MKALNKETNEFVAIKTFKFGDDSIVGKKIASREIQTLSSLSHPNIVQLQEVIKKGSKTHLIFEFVDTTLHEIIQKYPSGVNLRTSKKIIFHCQQ